MPEVTFYLLASPAENDRVMFTCKLVEKAYRAMPAVYVLTSAEENSRVLDEKLWTFRAGSFIPHQIFSGTAPEYKNQVLIGSLSAPVQWQTTIINISEHCPDQTDKADRILEILSNNESDRKSGRQRYRQYQESGLTINTYQV